MQEGRAYERQRVGGEELGRKWRKKRGERRKEDKITGGDDRTEDGVGV